MTADTVGGVWTYSLELAAALARRGVCVELATMGEPATAAQRLEAAALRLPLHESRFRLEWMQDPWEDVRRAGEWLLALESRLLPDVIHLNGYAHGALPFAAPTVIVGHSCCLSWWRAVRGRGAPPSWDRYRAEVTRGLARARHVVAPTRAMLDELDRLYGPLPSSSVIPNGRAFAVEPRGARERLVVAAGRAWDAAKNLTALDAAAARLDAPVLVAGEPAPPPGAQGGATFRHARPLGRLAPSELAALFARAAVFAHPAKYEPFGLTPVEAALAGCALVLGDIRSLREVWGDAADFVPPDDPVALAGAIQALLDDPSLRARRAADALARARRYTPAAQARLYHALYDRLRGEEVACA